MTSSKPTSAADQQLINHAACHGFTITAKQLAGWRKAGLLPGNIPGGGLGQGNGSTSAPAPESFDLVLGLARHAGSGKRPGDRALLLFADGLPVPEATVRAAFRASVDADRLPGEDDIPSDELDLDERLDRLSNQIADTDQRITLVPARARRIDERIARTLGEPPAELAELDHNTDPPRLTALDATMTALAATLGSSVPLQDLAAVFRVMSPGMPANPLASLVETTRDDVPEVASKVLADDDSLAFLPEGDPRDVLRDLADTAPLEDLAAAWRTAVQVREWALDLCRRVEDELDAGQHGEAVTEWMLCRLLPAGLSVITALRERWAPAKNAFSALLWLYQCQSFVNAESEAPGCQWHLLQLPGVMPPPARDLILTKVPVPEPTTPTEPSS